MKHQEISLCYLPYHRVPHSKAPRDVTMLYPTLKLFNNQLSLEMSSWWAIQELMLFFGWSVRFLDV